MHLHAIMPSAALYSVRSRAVHVVGVRPASDCALCDRVRLSRPHCAVSHAGCQAVPQL